LVPLDVAGHPILRLIGLILVRPEVFIGEVQRTQLELSQPEGDALGVEMVGERPTALLHLLFAEGRVVLALQRSTSGHKLPDRERA